MGKGIHKGEKIRASTDTIFNEWDEVLEKLQKSEVPLTSSDILSLSEKIEDLGKKKPGEKYNKAREKIRIEIEKLKEKYERGGKEKSKTPEEKSQKITEQINEVGAEIKNEGKEQEGKVEEKLEKTNLGDKEKEEILNETKKVTETANREAQEAAEKAQEEKGIFKKCEELESEIRDEKDKRIQRIKESNKIINFNNYKIHFVIVLRGHKWLEKSDAREKIEGLLNSINKEIKEAVDEKNKEIEKAAEATDVDKQPEVQAGGTGGKTKEDFRDTTGWDVAEPTPDQPGGEEKEKEKLEEQPKKKEKEILSQEEMNNLINKARVRIEKLKVNLKRVNEDNLRSWSDDELKKDQEAIKDDKGEYQSYREEIYNEIKELRKINNDETNKMADEIESLYLDLKDTCLKQINEEIAEREKRKEEATKEAGETVEETEKKEKIKKEEEKLGKEKEQRDKLKNRRGNKAIRGQVFKSLGRTVASVVGIQSVVDVPTWFHERRRVRGKFLGIKVNKGLAGSTDDLLTKSFNMKDEWAKGGERKKYKGKGEKGKVMKAIEDLNKRLRLTREGSARASQLNEKGELRGSKERKMIADLLKKHRKEYGDKRRFNKKEAKKEMDIIVNDYITTKVTGMQAARETLNSFFTVSGAYVLRGASYGIMDALERNLKLRKELKQDKTDDTDKIFEEIEKRVKAETEKEEKIKRGEKIIEDTGGKNKKEKIKREWNLIKDTFWGGFKETCKEATFQNINNNEKRSKSSKSLNAVRAWGKIFRYVGITGTAIWHPETAGNAINKVLDALGGKANLSDVENNFIGNIERLRKFYSQPIKWAINKFSPEDLPPPKPGTPTPEQPPDGKGAPQKIIPGKQPTGSEVQEVTPAVPQGPKVVNEDVVRLGIVHQGKGIEHALMKQLEDDPEGYGFIGDVNNEAEVEKWVGDEAHRLAIKGGYVKFETGGHQPDIPEQMRVGKADTVACILNKDKSDRVVAIEEWVKNKDGKFELRETHPVAEDFKSAKFEGTDKEEYEYVKDKEVVAKPTGGGKQDIKIQIGEEPDILEKINKGIMTDFEIEQGLKMRNIDINGDGQPEMVNIIDRNNNIIGEFEVKSAEDIYEIKKSVSNTLENFEKIQDGKIKISVENVDKAGIKLFDKGGLDESDIDKIKFWVQHKDGLLYKPEIAKNFFELSEKLGHSYKIDQFQSVFREMQKISGLEEKQEVGYMRIFLDKLASRYKLIDGSRELLGDKVVDTTGIVEKKGNSIIIHDAYGNKGYDIILTKDKIGIDGPAWHNKWLQSGRPTENISSESLKALKGLIGDLKKGIEESLGNSQKRFE